MTVGLSTAHLLIPGAAVAGMLDAWPRLAPAAVELAAGGPEALQRAFAGGVGYTSRPAGCRGRSVLPGPAAVAGPALAASIPASARWRSGWCERSIYAAAEFGARVVVLRSGGRVRRGVAAARRAFERGELDEKRGSASAPSARPRPPRRISTPTRLALEPLLRVAEAATVTAGGVQPSRSTTKLPDPAELGRLLADFRGAPLGTFYDTAAAHVQEALGSGAAGRVSGRLRPAGAAGRTSAMRPGPPAAWRRASARWISRRSRDALPKDALRFDDPLRARRVTARGPRGARGDAAALQVARRRWRASPARCPCSCRAT